MGPHQAYGNIPRSIEFAVGWIADLIGHCRDHSITRIEAKEEGVKQWTDHVHALGKNLLSNKVDSWMTGVNKNVAGKQVRTVARYMGSAPDFRKECHKVSDAEYQAFELGYSEAGCRDIKSQRADSGLQIVPEPAITPEVSGQYVTGFV